MSFKHFFEEDRHTAEIRKHLPLLKKLKAAKIKWYNLQEITDYINDNSSGVKIGSIKKQLSDSGYFYLLKDVPVSKLMIDGEEFAKNEIETPHVDKDKPIVVGIVDGHEFYVIDGRHRSVSAKMLGNKTIKAFVPFELLNKL